MGEKDGELPLGCGIAILTAVCGPMFLLSVGGIIWGWIQVHDQHRLLSTASETEAIIVTSKVEWQPDANDPKGTYKPVVQFKYSVDAKSHESSMVSPARDAGRHGWAEEVVRKFPVGRRTTAYFDPADPTVAFLLREYLPDPYVFTAFASMFAAFAIVFPASFFWPWPPVRTGMALAGFVVYELPIIAAVKHYFEHAVPQHHQAGAFSVIAISLGAVPLWLAFRWWHLDPKRVAKKLYADE